MWCIGMSEPDAGSDVASLRTTAVLDGNEWVVNGQKIWNSGGAEAEWCYLVARTDPDAPKHKGLSEFIVDMSSPGITVKPIRDMTDDEHFCEIYFDDVRVPDGNLVGALNGSFRQLMRQMEHERGGIDRLVSNKRLYLDCLEELRRTGAAPTTRSCARRSPPSSRPTASAACWCCARRSSRRRAASRRRPRPSAPSSRSGSPSSAGRPWAPAPPCGRRRRRQRLARRVARNICYAPGYTIMGGTTQILRNILGERVLGLPR